ncbi:MAG TPA: hypothetical protein VK660_00025, partial [Xanthomonadaceae bacterium]|nr:hypothetical protein [Xanthomonadaceae bacterium]
MSADNEIPLAEHPAQSPIQHSTPSAEPVTQISGTRPVAATPPTVRPADVPSAEQRTPVSAVEPMTAQIVTTAPIAETAAVARPAEAPSVVESAVAARDPAGLELDALSSVAISTAAAPVVAPP